MWGRLMPNLEISLFGPFAVHLDGEIVSHFESVKCRALLAYLAAEAGRPQARSKLAGLLWSNFPERSALRNLSQCLYSLRKTLKHPNCLEVDRQTLRLNPGPACQVDTLRLEQALAGFQCEGSSAVAGLQSAIDAARGPFLDGFTLDDNPEFETWVLYRREYHDYKMIQTWSV